MNIFKFLIIILLSLAAVLITQTSANARCSIDTLKNVCTICEERALNSLSLDSACPVCPEVTCPKASQACIRLNSFEPFLSSNYTLTGMIWQDVQDDVLFKLNIAKNENTSSTFNYEVRYDNFRIALQNGMGLLLYDIVSFSLPVSYGEGLLSYNCIGAIDNTSIFQGVCSTIANDGAGNPRPYSWTFTAIPNSNPLQ